MKHILGAIALASVAFAQGNAPELPSCANDCVTKFTSGPDIAGCRQGNIECVCSNSAFLDEVACCLAGACSDEELDDAVSFARSLCSGAGVEVPDEVVCKEDKPTGGDDSSDEDSTEDSDDGSDGSDDDSAENTDEDSDNSEDQQADDTEGGDSAANGRVVPMAGLVGGALAALAML